MNTSNPQPTLPNLQTAKRISGLTHAYYRYPATTSPELVRDIVCSLSRENDLVLDPFMGGGTSIVESVAHGRRAIGFDLNPLAVLVTRAKTTPLTSNQWEQLEHWATRTSLFQRKGGDVDPRTTNLPRELRLSFAATLAQLGELSDAPTRLLARCSLLSLGRWALESCRELPSPQLLRRQLRERISVMRDGMDELVASARAHGVTKSRVAAQRRLVSTSAENGAPLLAERLAGGVNLVLTSPPYPGVHVLYHRWQVEGRRETPAPYWIADRRDGSGPAFYTMGGRSSRGQLEYFDRLEDVFVGLWPLLADNALIAQLVAFHDVEQQLPLYLSAMRRAGFKPRSRDSTGALSRLVPNRRWYARGRNFDSSREFLLVHTKR